MQKSGYSWYRVWWRMHVGLLLKIFVRNVTLLYLPFTKFRTNELSCDLCEAKGYGSSNLSSMAMKLEFRCCRQYTVAEWLKIKETFGSRLTHRTAKNSGEIQLILGPMFSGKSAELIRRVTRYEIANRKCKMIKYESDKRYSVYEVATHDKKTFPAEKTKNLWNVRLYLDVEVIGIDEGQFFPDIAKFSEIMANHGLIVVVAALGGDYRRKPFKPTLKLIPLAETIIKLNAVCMKCYKDAAFSERITSEAEVEVIGGKDKYRAVCRKCHEVPDASLPKSQYSVLAIRYDSCRFARSSNL